MATAGGDGPGGAPHADRWEEWQAAEAAERAARASAELAAIVASRRVPPALPTEVWVLVMDRAESCRCALARGGRGGSGSRRAVFAFS